MNKNKFGHLKNFFFFFLAKATIRKRAMLLYIFMKEDHTRTIPVKSGLLWPSGLRRADKNVKF